MSKSRNTLVFAGYAVFLLMYLLAAGLYPGGNNVDKTEPGFDWLRNYWCDLLDSHAHNGTPNPAQPVAISAMLVLATAMSLLWYDLPVFLQSGRRNTRWMRFFGIGSMCVAVFLFTPLHNAVVNVAGLLMSAAFGFTLFELYRTGRRALFAGGLFCLLLWVGTYFIYQTWIFLPALALAQKIALACTLGWCAAICAQMLKKTRFSPPNPL